MRKMSYSNSLHQAQAHDVLRSWQSQRNDVNHHKDFVLPMFIGNDDDACEPIETMPDVFRYGANRALEYLEPLVNEYGLRAILLFPVVTKTDQERLYSGHQEACDESIGAHSGSNSSESPNSSSHEALSTTSDEDSEEDEEEDMRQRRASSAVMPEPLLPIEDEQSPTFQQNPFLNQLNEEEDHLLTTVEQSGASLTPIDDSHQLEGPLARQRQQQQPPPPPPRVGQAQGVGAATRRSIDVKLIKGMALKDKFNPVLRLIPKLKQKFPDLLIICDVCLCAFTSTGHCCLFDEITPGPQQLSKGPDATSLKSGNLLFQPLNHHSLRAQHNQHQQQVGSNQSGVNLMSKYPISNKTTCQYLAMLAVEYAQRGCDVVAPSDMMDDRILIIRERLNEHRLQRVSILSYSAKFASAFYGPFRQATNNAPEFGDRRTYQLPPGSRAMALKAVKRDINQGADFIMVKPGGAYLDIVRDIRELHQDVPIAVYQVSGEYAMMKLAAKANILDLKLAVNESLTAFRRAGATIIITYFTPELLRGEL